MSPRSLGRPARLGLAVACALAAFVVFALAVSPVPASASGPPQDVEWNDAFRQLEELLPTPNDQRTASGAPGAGYWQQRADYEIDVTLDDEARRIEGSEWISYHNHSPDTLPYLWLQIDPNLLMPEALGFQSEAAPDFEDDTLRYSSLRRLLALEDRGDAGATIHAVRDADGGPLEHTLVQTMLRIDLPQPLAPGESVRFGIDWSYPIPDAVAVRLRSGYEVFEEDGNAIYEIAQWFPRMAAYTDVNGWHHKQFLGRGEFTLEFGDYLVRITAPDDHVVTATGELQNPDEVLKPAWRERLREAETSERPVFVITPEEAEANESSRSTDTKTWVFRAENVRDFAFASSRKFIWDAWLHDSTADGGNRVMAMSFYPNEAEPLWSKYSTHAIVHTLEVYSRYTFQYPYPVAISVNGPVGGMEYPMICFNGPRAESDGTYFGERPKKGPFGRFSKYSLISVIIHEVGHNFFPMIVNSDERQWTWMDEGLNTFLQSLAEGEWEPDYPTRRGKPEQIVEYMLSDRQVPIMTNSESLLQFGNNAYAKPATALNVLRSTILGPELFDFAFREYARRWKFKRPMPADFFRSMEDASGTDLDWFWRGWFYGTDHVDLGIESVRVLDLDTLDPSIEKGKQRLERDAEPTTPRDEELADVPKRTDRHPELRDFYNDYDDLDVTPQDREAMEKALEGLEPWERELLATDRVFHVLDFVNEGGLVMPILLRVTYADGSSEDLRLPAEIWRRSPRRVSKLLIRDHEIVSVEIDPRRETADADRDDNHWPRQPIRSRFRLYKDEKPKNPMQEAREAQDGGQDERDR